MFRVRFVVLVPAALGLLALAPGAAAEPPAPKPASPVPTALRFVQHFAAPDALAPGKDRALKIKLITALAKAPELSWADAGDLFDRAAFRALAGDRDAITVARMEQLLRDRTPQSRADMNPKVRAHADLLTTQFDLIEEAHRKPAEELVEWIAKNYQLGKPLNVVVICTRNTRRSMLGATMGNVAAAYYGLPDVRFYSGGTDPDAFNPRSIAALKGIGIEIEPTGKDAPRGSGGGPNPEYRVTWGKGLEAREFSKKYSDAHNPATGFAAVMVCSEADTNCPIVKGAGARVAVPYLDPKAFDGAPFEAAKYAERRDDEGRFMLSVLMQARRRLELAGKLK
ncbi:MAG: hypothetical protein FJ304_11965 [Planctomycetes bacterium]|nr:hypothetical protein [Planctomycetota bacterium]